MRWAEILVETTSQAQEAVTNIMLENGCGGTVILDNEVPVIVKGYLPVDDRLEDRLLNIRESVKNLPEFGIDSGSGEMTIKYAEDQDWAESWKQFFKTTHVGKRIVIKPTWEAYEPQRNEIVVELDPGMAFGTGSHATTRLCLEALEKYMKPRMSVVDFGTGSGILAIAAAKMRASIVIAFDSDDLAVKAARENVILNGVEESVEVHRAEGPKFINRQVDIVTANIVAEVIIEYADQIAGVLRTGGLLIASGITTGKALNVEQALRNVGFDIAKTLKEGEWVAIAAIKSV
ncbi:MAG: 50S ribosomal protein L11 methyltransferase [Armatimonadota bacterium]